MLVVTAVQSSQATAATVPGSAEQVVTLDLKPRNAALLQQLAARSSGRAPLSGERLAELFYPTEAQVATVRTAMAGQGFRLIARHGLALRFAGAPAAAKRAFGESQAPGQPPASLAGLVSDIEGLEGTPSLKPRAVAGPRTVTPSCSGAQDLHETAGGYLPAQLASPAGYDHDALINAGYDGGGERIAFVEFSNYLPSDIAAYQSCFGLSVPITDVPVAGGNAQRNSALEVSLDVETAISAAPGLDHAYVYIAPPTTSMASVLDQIVAEQPSTGVHVISVSWGLCETLMTPSRVAATNTALQIAAVAGISVLVGSGDQGSLDCGLPPLSVDDPAAQPFATAVGGTSLFLDRTGPQREVVWNDLFGAGGGGISRFWAKPTWQTGPGVINSYSSGVPCHRSAGVCREVPDVSLNATAGRRGYIVHCTAGDCFREGWMLSGGTSASAPLMAGIVADANQYSRAHGGQRLGFANPFLYQTFQDTGSVFRDITLGDNSLGFDGRYPATAGYDLATGIGSVGAQGLATALAAFSPSAPTLRPTTLTAAPSRPRIVLYGAPITFRGQLRGPSGRARRAGRVPAGHRPAGVPPMADDDRRGRHLVDQAGPRDHPQVPVARRVSGVATPIAVVGPGIGRARDSVTWHRRGAAGGPRAADRPCRHPVQDDDELDAPDDRPHSRRLGTAARRGAMDETRSGDHGRPRQGVPVGRAASARPVADALAVRRRPQRPVDEHSIAGHHRRHDRLTHR